MLVTGRRFVPGLLLIVAGLFDIFDGGVARLRGEAGPAGAFLDSVLDRISDVILFSALFWSLSGQGHRAAAAFALVDLIVSLLVSQVRAEDFLEIRQAVLRRPARMDLQQVLPQELWLVFHQHPEKGPALGIAQEGPV